MSRVTIERIDADHGTIPWSGRFDREGYAIFECAVCGRTLGLRPGGHKIIDRGRIIAKYQAYITIDIICAAVDLGLWDMVVPEVDFSLSITDGTARPASGENAPPTH